MIVSRYDFTTLSVCYLLTYLKFYEFSTKMSALKSISSFTVIVGAGGKAQLYDNNGKGFPISDGVMVQTPGSCVNNGRLSVLAAVRFNSTNILEICLHIQHRSEAVSPRESK
jgi:hypothetical protein